ncbi:hypothetical protein CEY12_06165 [Chryseobacterium sp. T16E-39]|uniref:hypothetical protein n=1 Tax=Chryseobacterium sp. T16E-39 TaxID=2015076 RepID=UPI000B5B1807|nr:hypothetical protein [Chryseobacterium sp. T16E-39]ASK29713.1 hypothetical protein CEY12_06165 [Chryseobacterium sp. T16E-39]
MKEPKEKFVFTLRDGKEKIVEGEDVYEGIYTMNKDIYARHPIRMIEEVQTINGVTLFQVTNPEDNNEVAAYYTAFTGYQ